MQILTAIHSDGMVGKSGIFTLGDVMALRKICFIIVGLLCLMHEAIEGFNLPAINLGLTSFLDGVAPAGPGWYVQEYLQMYHANKLVDNKGKNLGGVPPIHFNDVAFITQIIYASPRRIFFGGRPGVNLVVPYLSHLSIARNPLGIKSSGAGFGDILFGGFFQWDPITYCDRPLFAHRLELDISVPTGKVKLPKDAINPGNGLYYINPYWAGTFFFTKSWSASWRIHYLWSGKQRKTHIKPGDAFFMNFTTEYNFCDKIVVGVNGYFLEQLKNSKLKGKDIPHSREQVFAIGPGMVYTFGPNSFLFLNYYIESYVRNRPKGMEGVIRYVQHF